MVISAAAAVIAECEATLENSRLYRQQNRELLRALREALANTVCIAREIVSLPSVHLNGNGISAALAPQSNEPEHDSILQDLTRREIEVLKLIGEGYRNKEIAFQLGIAFKTVITHRSNIMEKLGIHEGPRLVRLAIRAGLVEP